jgi:coatomer protein complex subunit gamma
MSYMKKDEDADQTMIKLDRTSVFQDGERRPLPNRSCIIARRSFH